jgi:hypothetical protein
LSFFFFKSIKNAGKIKEGEEFTAIPKLAKNSNSWYFIWGEGIIFPFTAFCRIAGLVRTIFYKFLSFLFYWVSLNVNEQGFSDMPGLIS